MGVSPKTYEQWRDHARQAASDDRFTVLWDELYDAHKHLRATPGGSSSALWWFRGLRRAYALITGDTERAVQVQIENRFADEQARHQPASSTT